MSSEIIQNVAYDNYDDFQYVNFIFSQIFISLFWVLINNKTDLRVRYYCQRALPIVTCPQHCFCSGHWTANEPLLRSEVGPHYALQYNPWHYYGNIMVTNKFKNQNLAQPIRRCSMHPTGPWFFSFGRGMRVFSFLCWVSGGCKCFYSYFLSWVAFCVMTHFLWFNLQGACEGPKVVLLY